MSKCDVEKLAPQHKSAFFSFIKVFAPPPFIITGHAPLTPHLTVPRNIQRRPRLPNRPSLPSLTSINRRILRLLGRTPLPLRRTRFLSRSRNPRSLSPKMVSEHLETAAQQ
jgi:hypothetical protein